MSAAIYLPSGTAIGEPELASLIETARTTELKRARYCLHADADDKIHQMVIAVLRDSYVAPHRHLDKCESFQMIKGELEVVLFDAKGVETQRIALGEPGSGKPFLMRHSGEQWHTVLTLSEVVVFVETTTGPFRREATQYAEWAPTPDDAAGIATFFRKHMK